MIEYTFSLEASVLDRIMPLKTPHCVPTLQRDADMFNMMKQATEEQFNSTGQHRMVPMSGRGLV